VEGGGGGRSNHCPHSTRALLFFLLRRRPRGSSRRVSGVAWGGRGSRSSAHSPQSAGRGAGPLLFAGLIRRPPLRFLLLCQAGGREGEPLPSLPTPGRSRALPSLLLPSPFVFRRALGRAPRSPPRPRVVARWRRGCAGAKVGVAGRGPRPGGQRAAGRHGARRRARRRRRRRHRRRDGNRRRRRQPRPPLGRRRGDAGRGRELDCGSRAGGLA